MKFVTGRVLGCVLFLACAGVGWAQTTGRVAPGAPGADAHWAGAGKDGIGTSNTLASKVWFTLRDGVMTEVYYPTTDVANSRELEFVVVSADGKRVEMESSEMAHRLELLDPRSLSFRQINTARSGAYRIVKTYTTDPRRSTVLIDVQFESPDDSGYALYVYYDPSMNNSGMHDAARTEGEALIASEADKTSALVCNAGFVEMTNGYDGASDGLTQLRQSGRIREVYTRAPEGNVVQVARIAHPRRFTLALGIGRNAKEASCNARASLARGFERVRSEYDAGWHAYLATLKAVEPKYQRQVNMAAMALRAHEDKTHRGATVASLSIPWGGGANANEPGNGGYHAVWARDLYHVATALEALGDRAAANRALDYLFRTQQRPDGSFPQNSRVDGRPILDGLQMDEVAYPLVLAYQLGRMDQETWLGHVKPAADFLVRHGPGSPQDRWEEERGYSPSTIAAEIAGLVCAADIAEHNEAHRDAGTYLDTADDWAQSVERWTATTTGPLGSGSYYLRVTGNGRPDAGERVEINSGGGTYDEREIVDAGFLELVRLGVRRADDPLIVRSLEVVDRVLKVETPKGTAWRRYNHDAYGERPDGGDYDGQHGVGRLWTLLTGERGEYELAHGSPESARERLDSMLGFANEGLMIPEQIWDRPESPAPAFRFGEGTGSATPLAWSMAQFIRLAVNLREGRNLDTPAAVYARYRRISSGAETARPGSDRR